MSGGPDAGARPDAVVDRVRALVATLARQDLARVTTDSTWRRLGLDSLDILDLLVGCEQTFGIVIPDEFAASFGRVQDVVDFLTAARAVEGTNLT